MPLHLPTFVGSDPSLVSSVTCFSVIESFRPHRVPLEPCLPVLTVPRDEASSPLTRPAPSLA